jgi:hypothetical protein
MRKTYILDIDGTLLFHIPNFEQIYLYPNLDALPMAKEKTFKWHCEGHYIILTSARPESLRDLTIKQLDAANIVYDLLILGVGAGPRILVNDYVDEPKAMAFNVKRNVDGLKDVE